MDQKMFADNNTDGFSPHNCWAACSNKANIVSINLDEIILNFLSFYNEFVEYV